MIRVGFIGLGRIADLHQLGYVGNPDAQLCAVCDTNSKTVEARKNEWGVPKAYTDHAELLADPDIDAVEIIAPQTVHEPIVLDAVRAGKHIAVQKPMTTSLDSANRMLEAVSTSDRVYKVTDNYLTYPPIIRLR